MTTQTDLACLYPLAVLWMSNELCAWAVCNCHVEDAGWIIDGTHHHSEAFKKEMHVDFIFIKVTSSGGCEFLQLFRDKYIKLIVIIYVTLIGSNLYFQRINFEIHDIQTCQINPGKHVKIDSFNKREAMWFYHFFKLSNGLSNQYFINIIKQMQILVWYRK